MSYPSNRDERSQIWLSTRIGRGRAPVRPRALERASERDRGRRRADGLRARDEQRPTCTHRLRAGDRRTEAKNPGRGARHRPWRPTPRSPGPADPSGRGLRIVEAMSDTWGVIPSPNGNTMWFTLAQRSPVRDEIPASAATDRSEAAGENHPPAPSPAPSQTNALVVLR